MGSTNNTSRPKESTAAKGVQLDGWQFVNLSRPKQSSQDKDLRRLIRVNAMRDYRRKQKQPPVPSTITVTPTSAASVTMDSLRHPASPLNLVEDQWVSSNKSEDISWEELQAVGAQAIVPVDGIDSTVLRPTAGLNQWPYYPHYEAAFSPNPVTLLGPGSGDPFDMYPLEAGSQYHSHILNHFVRVMALDYLPGPVPNNEAPGSLAILWLSYALQDETLFLATLNFASVHLDILARRPISSRALAYKSDVIKTVNNRLASSEEALSNSTIGAVAMLAAVESFSGNCKETRIHMYALKQMTDMRGGLWTLGWQDVVGNFIAWQDLRTPSEVAKPLNNYRLSPCCSLRRRTLPFKSPIFSSLGYSTEVCAELATIFHNMHYVSRSLAVRCTSSDLLALSTMRAEIELRLHELAKYSKKSGSEMSLLDHELETCRIAALVFTNYALQPSFPSTANDSPGLRYLKSQLVARLKESEESNNLPSKGVQRGPTAWALFMGGLLALNEDEEMWFAWQIAKGARKAGIRDWQEMEARQRKIAWRDELSEGICKKLWERADKMNAAYWNGVGPPGE